MAVCFVVLFVYICVKIRLRAIVMRERERERNQDTERSPLAFGCDQVSCSIVIIFPTVAIYCLI